MTAERLRVAIVTGSLRGAGAEKQAYLIVRGLQAAGVDVRVYCLNQGGVYETAMRTLGVEPTFFGRFQLAPLRLFDLIAALRRFRPHVIQSIHAYTNVYSGLAGRALGTLCIGGLRSNLTAFLADYPRALSMCLLRLPNSIVVNSMTAVQDIQSRRLLAADRVHFLGNGIDLSDLPDTDRSASNCTCLYVGRLVQGKRVDVFLRAVALARTSDDSIRAVIVGDGPESNRLKQLAAELELSPEHVVFAGFRTDVAEMYSAGSMFVLPSESEGTPNVVLEAMAAGLPIVATPAGDTRQIIEGAQAGFVVPFGDVSRMAEAITTLAASADLRRQFASAGRRHVEQQYAAAHIAKGLLRIYEKASQHRSQHGRSGRVHEATRILRQIVASTLTSGGVI